jgi:ribosomal protein S20
MKTTGHLSSLSLVFKKVYDKIPTMPIIASAAKALRKDVRRTQVNRRWRDQLKTALDAFRDHPSPKLLVEGFRIIDRSAQHHIIHPNKADRLKSQLSHLLALKPTVVKSKPARKKPSPKTAA